MIEPFAAGEGWTIYQGDAFEIVRHLDLCDALVTDPPYGVEFGGRTTKHSRKRFGAYMADDSVANIVDTVIPIVCASLGRAHVGAVMCGIRCQHLYPQPRSIGGICAPNGASRSRWGFGCINPVLYYGKDPYLARGLGGRPDSYVGPQHNMQEELLHPAQKPLKWMLWLVERCSPSVGEVVLDPFAGSATTGVAAIKLGRRFIGIELDPHWAAIAAERLRKAEAEVNAA